MVATVEVETAVALASAVRQVAECWAEPMEEAATMVGPMVAAQRVVEKVVEGRVERRAAGARAVAATAQCRGVLEAVKEVVGAAAQRVEVDSAVAGREAVGRTHAASARVSSPHAPAECA